MTGPRLSDEERLVAKKRKADKQRERRKVTQASNDKKYYTNNKEKILERRKQWIKDNPEKYKQYVEKQKESSKEKLRITSINNAKKKLLEKATHEELIIFAKEILNYNANCQL